MSTARSISARFGMVTLQPASATKRVQTMSGGSSSGCRATRAGAPVGAQPVDAVEYVARLFDRVDRAAARASAACSCSACPARPVTRDRAVHRCRGRRARPRARSAPGRSRSRPSRRAARTRARRRRWTPRRCSCTPRCRRAVRRSRPALRPRRPSPRSRPSCRTRRGRRCSRRRTCGRTDRLPAVLAPAGTTSMCPFSSSERPPPGAAQPGRELRAPVEADPADGQRVAGDVLRRRLPQVDPRRPRARSRSASACWSAASFTGGSAGSSAGSSCRSR